MRPMKTVVSRGKMVDLEVVINGVVHTRRQFIPCGGKKSKTSIMMKKLNKADKPRPFTL